MQIQPNGQLNTRTIEVRGLTKSQLIDIMHQQSIAMNEYAKKLFSDDRFITSHAKYRLKIFDVTVEDLGFTNGATLPQIFKKAIKLGLELCPLELGPHLRLEYVDQPEGYLGTPSKNQAPSGSITIAPEIISEDDDFPKGFYLRKIEGVLWLRGYIADHLHVWNPDDHFVFCQRL
ncbi:helicase [Oceanobacillus luteolus]|uniref:helicase n=1 Tax=Oceanobacillus luteolus TaxID=1274358 RepID=UPI00203AED1D|nr:helicase [Oceanobacillus luteolus]MCM3740310.1 helicase [Oceanobacillus luteolus]